jgi:hypothetical protein
MRSKTTTVGALHPILFFAGVYVVVLLFSIFICSTIFYSCNTTSVSLAKKTEKKEQKKQPAQKGYAATTSIAAIQ